MRRFIRIVAGLAIAGSCLGSPPQDVIQDLLKTPAPLPSKALPIERPVEQAPAEDAPLAVLADYWARHPAPDAALDESPEFAARFNREPMPSERIRHRLLEAAEADPGILARLLSRLPDTPSSYDRIKSLLDDEKRQPRYGADWSTRVERYLMFHSRYFRQELTRAAREALDENYKVKGDAELGALAKLDWAAAEPILKTHAEGRNARTAALSLALIYGHHVEAGAEDKARPYREVLMRIVEDRSAPGYARDAAAKALLSTRWEGLEAWYESLFHDPTLLDLSDGYQGYAPLGRIDMPAEEWVRLLARLAGSSDRTAHDAAVSCLVGIEDPTRDALLPLLPWLDDPGWSSARRDRGMFIAKLRRVRVPEAVPGLIAVIDREGDPDRATAAFVMASYADPKAAPALRRLLEKETRGRTRMDIVRGLVACGDVAEDEAVSSIEAFAEQVALRGESGDLRFALMSGDPGVSSAPSVLIGMYLADFPPPGEAVARRLLERAKVLRTGAPQVAAALLDCLSDWPARAIDRDLAALIMSGAVDLSAIISALRRRDSLRLAAARELETAARSGGIAAGVAAIILGGPERTAAILGGSDLPAQRALLACARLVGDHLPVPLVGQLLRSADEALAEAAEAYLTAEDGPEARRLVLSVHEGQAAILGESMPDIPGHSNLAVFSGLEKQLQEEALEGLEIYALLSAGYWGSDGQAVLRIKADSAELTYTADPARCHLREIPAAELADFRGSIASSGIEEAGPLFIGDDDSVQYEYLHLTKAGGRRVILGGACEDDKDRSPHCRAYGSFKQLLGSGDMRLEYQSADRMPGFEILLADPGVLVSNVWKEGPDTRVLALRLFAPGGGHGPAEFTILRTDGKEPEWTAFAEGRLGPPAPPPAGFATGDLKKGVPPEMFVAEDVHRSSWLLDPGGVLFRIGTWNRKYGLWRLAAGRDPELLLEGNCAAPIITPDGKWAVVAKTDTSWAVPNYVVCLDLMKGSSNRLKVPDAKKFYPVVYVPAHKKVLLSRSRGPGGPNQDPQEETEFLLLEPATGVMTGITGEFAPYLEGGRYPLQPAKAPDEVWAALFRPDSRTTEVGRYNTRSFTFSRTLSVPSLRFGSEQMWIDDQEGKIYVAYGGHLLRMALPDR